MDSLDGKPNGALGSEEIPFHSDLSYLPEPGTISSLYALEIPDEGGETMWANGYASYDALTPGMKARIDGLSAVHRRTVRMETPMAGRRPGHVGQPLHHASPHALHRPAAPRHVAHTGVWRGYEIDSVALRAAHGRRF